MRLWYQSLGRLDTWAGYDRALRRILDQTKDPETLIEVHGITGRGGVGDQYRYLEFLETGEVLENVARAERAGFDAFLIGNIADPGLREAREITSMPVLGLCETSVHVACMMGASFALVTSNEKHQARVLENVARYGLGGRMIGATPMHVERLLRLNEAFSDAHVREDLIGRFREAAALHVRAGAEVVIPAVGVFMALLADAGVHDVGHGTPILNGITALVKTGEAVVKMNRIMGGRFTSKRNVYAPPSAEQLPELRRYYGEVYPAPGVQPGHRSAG